MFQKGQKQVPVSSPGAFPPDAPCLVISERRFYVQSCYMTNATGTEK